MVPGPTPDDAFFATDGRGEAEFWTEADRPRTRPHRHHRRRTGRRIAAAWAAESSARRALRGRSDGKGEPPQHRHRQVAAAVIGGLALLAAALAATEAMRDGATPAQEAKAGAEADPAARRPDAARSPSATAVDPEIIDAPAPTRSGARPAPTKAATTTTSRRSRADDPAASTPAHRPVPVPVPAPNPSKPPAPSTAAPATTTPTATPTTAAPKPPAAPRIGTFTAKAASSAGGPCPPLQWATTFAWSTSDASVLTITGLLEPTLRDLPGDGSRVVCRLLPGAPLGGWTLTATGPGGTVTAKA